jgi:hypothetical protein
MEGEHFKGMNGKNQSSNLGCVIDPGETLKNTHDHTARAF